MRTVQLPATAWYLSDVAVMNEEWQKRKMTADDNAEEGIGEAIERPWIVLKDTYDIETWIDHQSRHLQHRLAGGRIDTGYGIGFRLAAGGEIYMHTSPEGMVLLDVTEEAGWIAPLIAAATGAQMPAGRIWTLSVESLTQLLFGLNGLIATTRIVTDHDFRIRKR